MTNRELLEANGYDDSDIPIVIFNNPSYEGALIGVTDDHRAVYDFDLMVKALMKEDNIPYEEAMDFVLYNALSTCTNAPLIMYRLENFE